tara:strand:- start:246 stop:365 length:120 start_codon:yes stop_codon:yes gene_type:complete
MFFPSFILDGDRNEILALDTSLGFWQMRQFGKHWLCVKQ